MLRPIPGDVDGEGANVRSFPMTESGMQIFVDSVRYLTGYIAEIIPGSSRWTRGFKVTMGSTYEWIRFRYVRLTRSRVEFAASDVSFRFYFREGSWPFPRPSHVWECDGSSDGAAVLDELRAPGLYYFVVEYRGVLPEEGRIDLAIAVRGLE